MEADGISLDLVEDGDRGSERAIERTSESMDGRKEASRKSEVSMQMEERERTFHYSR
jgi:hypothetical protein